MGKYFVNLVAKRPDLWNSSLTAVPHAMHKKVIEEIGYDSLIIPPLAQMKAILAGFTMKAVQFVDVIKTNRIRPDRHEIVNGRIQAFDRILVTSWRRFLIYYKIQMSEAVLPMEKEIERLYSN